MKHYNSIESKERCDAANLFEYEIKGVKLDLSDLIRIHSYYEAACTAEYIIDNYHINSKEDALAIGYDVRRQMDKMDESGELEVRLVDECMEDYGGSWGK